MPRAVSQDFLMTNKFHLVDVSLTIPPVLLPAMGFSSVTSPELSIDVKEIKEGNFEYPRKVMQQASVNNLVCARGAALQDTDFFVWMDNYVRGKRDKKNLMLIQNTNISPEATGGGLEGLVGFPTTIEFGNTFAGRSWILKNCAPVRYKAASDFDASQGAISIQELEISYEFFVEFNMGT